MVTLLLLSLLSMMQCKKEVEEYKAEEPEMVPIRLEVPIDRTRSDFNNLFPFGDLAWGNEKKEEYIYFAVSNAYNFYSMKTGNHYLGILFELKSDIIEDDKIVFTGNIYNLNKYVQKDYTYIYYFGNNGNAAEGSNVTDIYEIAYYRHTIGKKITFDNQTGDVSDVGNYHVAKAKVTIEEIFDENGAIVEYHLSLDEPLKSITSVALLDLEGETRLEGTAAKLKSFTLEWVDYTEFVEKIEYDDLGYIDVSANAGERSLITLLPTTENVTLECSKGKYEFENGIKSNRVYFEKNGATLEEAQPLIWETQ